MKPDLINVFGKTFKISYIEMADNGNCEAEDSLIEINQNLEGQELVTTLLHEYFHALMDRVGLHQAVSDEVEEIICECFSTFLVDNGIVSKEV